MSIEQLLLGGHRAYDPTQSAHVTHPLVRCLAIYRTMPLRFGATFALFVVVNGSLTYYQYLLGLAVHDVERGQAAVRAADGSLDLTRALHWAYVLVAIAAARAVLQYVAGIAALSTGQELLYRLRDAILVQVQRLDLGYHLRHGVGEVVARTTRDADKVRDALISFWRNVIETGLVIAASLAILVWYAPILATVPALLIAVGIVMFLRQSDRLVVLDRAVGDAYDKVSQDLVEGVGGVRVIKAFSLERLRIERFDQSVLAFAAHATSAVRYAASRIPLPQILVALGQVWVFGVGASLVSRGRLNLGELVAAILAMNTLIFRFEGIGRVVQIFADARASAARIMDFLDARPEIVSGERKLPSGPLGVRLRSVTVSARGGDAPAILENLSLDVAPGETVAIVGATGSGKSAMVSLIPRLLDVTAGSVELGGPDVGYVDVRELSLDDLRHHVHLVTQDCFLFSDTLAENVRLAAPGSTDEEVLAALRRAAAADIVSEERGGLGMLIGDRGVTLSGGQRQRVALSRALLAKPSVLVLDDSTSALDAVTEQKILHGIRELRSDTTLLLVASKPSTVLFADRIVVLENGRIVAQGSHDDLYRRSATYRELLGMEDGN